MLKKERNYEFRERMLEIHKKGIRDFSLETLTDEFEINDGILIAIGKDADIVTETAAKDFADYLLTSMEIGAAVTVRENVKGAINVRIADKYIDMTDADSTKGFRIDTDGDGIVVYGFDARGCAQGLYYLEKCMTKRKAPYIKYGIVKKKPLFSPQMVHSGFGLDNYPNEHLNAIAHAGRDAILIFVEDVDKTPYGYLDFNELIYRASKYGIDVYAYSYIVNKYHPDDPQAKAYYDGTYGKLFRQCPGFKGIILVENALVFPSKDPAVRADTQLKDNIDSIPVGKPSTTGAPAYDMPMFLSMVKDLVQANNKDREFVVWSYSIQGNKDDEVRRKWIDQIPEGSVFLTTYDKNMVHINKAGARVFVTDYSLSNPYPGERFLSDLKYASEKGLKPYVMANTGGLTWDMGVMPYQPGAYLWIERYKEILNLAEKYGVCGLMESHHYGFYPSFVAELANEAFREKDKSMEDMLNDVLVTEFGDEHIDTIKKALQCMSDSNACYTRSSGDGCSTLRIGAAWPLCVKLGLRPPTVPFAHFGNRIVGIKYETTWNQRFRLNSEIIPEELESWKQAVKYASEGVAILNTIENPNDNLIRLILLCRYIECQCKSAVCAKKWVLTLRDLDRAKKEDVPAIVEKMRAMAADEIKNAEAAIECTDYDSRLGWEPSMEYIADSEHLRWKISQVKYACERELEEYLKAAREED